MECLVGGEGVKSDSRSLPMASNYPSPLMSPSTTGSVHLGLLGHPNFVSHHSPSPSLLDSFHILS